MGRVAGLVAPLLVGILAVCGGVDAARSQAAESLPLQLERKIPLGDVRGRIDHMAVDLKRQRLFVAELGNDTVGIVDLASSKLINRITGLKEPQGVGYDSSTDTLYVANAADGSVRLFEGPDYAAKHRIELGSDADNIRIDAGAGRILIGYGSGALAVIDAAARGKVADLPLSAHPEAFQIDPESNQVFVNVPESRAIVVVDRTSRKTISKWSLAGRSANFPMAVDPARRQVLVIFRAPTELGVFSMTDGKLISHSETCADADDLFIDAKRRLVYVSCGAGFVDVLEVDAAAYRRIARVPTVSGARTSLFVPELDRLLVAVRATPGEPAAIWVFRPNP
jgi:DNA-binding beta-propeller fold protein YncE